MYAKSKAEYDRLLEKVFGLIKLSGLKVNLNFLGHTVNAEGIQTNYDRIKKITQAITPKCVTQLRSFLGLKIYY